jgi:hypothetical protein
VTVIRRHLTSPAMIVACAALIVALGGVSYAAAVLPKNSVGSTQLQKKAVTGAKLKENAVTGAKVKNGSLLAADFKAGQLSAGPQGPKGDPGAQGPKGDAGPKGDPGATDVIQRQGTLGSAAGPGAYSYASVSCQGDEKLVGGGAQVGSLINGAKHTLVFSFPSSATWTVGYRNDGASGALQAQAFALCVAP